MANIVNVSNYDSSDSDTAPLLCQAGVPAEQGDVTPLGATVAKSHNCHHDDGDDDDGTLPVCLHSLYGDTGVRNEMRRTRFTYLPVAAMGSRHTQGTGAAGVDTDITPPSPTGGQVDTDNRNSSSRRRRTGKQQQHGDYHPPHKLQHSQCPRCDPVICDCSCSAPCDAPCVVCTLRRYHYDGEDESAISVLMTPFWDWCTRSLVPRWMAYVLLMELLLLLRLICVRVCVCVFVCINEYLSPYILYIYYYVLHIIQCQRSHTGGIFMHLVDIPATGPRTQSRPAHAVIYIPDLDGLGLYLHRRHALRVPDIRCVADTCYTP